MYFDMYTLLLSLASSRSNPNSRTPLFYITHQDHASQHSSMGWEGVHELLTSNWETFTAVAFQVYESQGSLRKGGSIHESLNRSLAGHPNYWVYENRDSVIICVTLLCSYSPWPLAPTVFLSPLVKWFLDLRDKWLKCPICWWALLWHLFSSFLLVVSFHINPYILCKETLMRSESHINLQTYRPELRRQLGRIIMVGQTWGPVSSWTMSSWPDL